MSEATNRQLNAAKRLLAIPDDRPEDQVRKGIANLLDALEVDCELSYPTDGGPADIYLPRRRIIVETKQVGLASDPEKPQARKNKESPKQQLERYLHAEISYEIRTLILEESVDKPWTGIVTDGKVWHVWRYPHEQDSVGISEISDFVPSTPIALVTFLTKFLEGEVVGKPWIPSDPRPLFQPKLEELREMYASLSGSIAKRTRTKMDLWLQMLRSSSMEPENDMARQRLFVAHSFLVVLARGVIHELTNPRLSPDIDHLLKDGFVSWIVDNHRGRQWASNLLIEISQYEWRRRPGDVLKPLYEQFVDANDRKDFGEYYTPDWLAELLVQQVCDDQWCNEAVVKAHSALRRGDELREVGVLDPTCGSGTFLYHTAARILAAAAISDLTESDKSAVICSLVHGIDVHPVAAEIARATLLRALPMSPPHGQSDVQIHEGDALLVHGDEESSVFRVSDDSFWLQTPQGVDVVLPRSFVARADFPDDLRRLVIAAEQGRDLPSDILEAIPKSDRDALTECHKQFIEIVENEGNSVWTWYIRNLAGPYRLSERKVDRVVANPPWVKMSTIQTHIRKRTLQQFAQKSEINLWPGGKQAPHFDIAQLFVKRVRNLYLVAPNDCPGAWLVKKSALKAGSWAKFRKWHYKLCKQTLDLEPIKPFGGGDARRCCVLFEGRASALLEGVQQNIVAHVRGGETLKAHDALEDVRDRLTFHLVPPEIPREQSGFVDIKGSPLFRQGATITPKVLTVVQRTQSIGTGWLRVTTSRSQHPPWSQLEEQQGDFPENWIKSLLTSRTVLPFSTSPREELRAILPMDNEGNLERIPAEYSEPWRRFDEIYGEYRGEGTHTPRTLISQIDYGSKLSTQLRLSAKSIRMVVYPSSGDIMRACRLRPGESVVDATLYYFVATTVGEAAYLVGLLNAPCLIDAFAQSRDSGRDFHLHPWRRLPIPRYDRLNPQHVELVKMTVQAERQVSKWLQDSSHPGELSQAALSKRLRKLLLDEGIFPSIDNLVRKLLPDQVHP